MFTIIVIILTNNTEIHIIFYIHKNQKVSVPVIRNLSLTNLDFDYYEEKNGTW
jgi:hypothetical protein